MAWILTMCGALFWQLAPSDNSLGIPTKAAADVMGYSPGSLGSGRQLMLVEATRLFRKKGADVPQAIMNGAALAPVTFLNDHLKAKGAKWRVRSTDGLSADIYEIS